jgi:aspartate/methionine/tyrosine aminotransferase
MQISPFKLERYFAKYEFNVRYLLCSSDCESLSIGELLALEPNAEEVLKTQWLGYSDSPGALTLRQEVSRLYHGIQPEQILVHSGAEEAIFLFMNAALQPGDHVIVHWPCYQSLYEIARSIGCEVTFWEARLQNNWALNLDELRHSLRPNTRVVVINTPHNPTGDLMGLREFLELNRLLQERDVILFCDEVYRGLEYDAMERLPSTCEINPSAVALGVMSKTYGLAGLRIGWIATQNTPILTRMAVLKDYTTICNSAPSEYLAELALRHHKRIVERNLSIIKENLSLLVEFFTKYQDRFEWVPPRAGPIAFPSLHGEDVEQFCKELVASAGVLLLPGTTYDHPGNNFRIGFARKNMPKALAQLELFLDSRNFI